MTPPLVILGAGGHARVLMEVARRCGRTVAAASGLEPARPAWLPDGVAYHAGNEAVRGYAPGAVELVNGLGSVGPTAARARLFDLWKAAGYRFATLVHPAAAVALDGVALGEGVQVMAGAVVQPGCAIGDDCIVNTAAAIDHDCRLGPHCHVAPGAVLSGGVSLGAGVHVGTGARIVQGLAVGDGAVIGAGAAVIRPVPAGRTAVGVPARILP
ncbi:MAG TPA: acetyltransferase [Alphaproteobacteria bacterium]|nr:acetyltransferase [Alphaproteobacteria bacterium]